MVKGTLQNTGDKEKALCLTLQKITGKQKQKHTKQTTRTGTEPQKWRSHGGLSLGE